LLSTFSQFLRNFQRLPLRLYLLFCIPGRVESFGIVRFSKKACYYEKLLKFLANFSPGLSETDIPVGQEVRKDINTASS